MEPKVQSLQDIMRELDPSYAPQRQQTQQQIAKIPGQIAKQRAGLEAQQRNSFNQITEGANRRGLVFSGIPLAEQADYTADVFLPAVAGLESEAEERKFSLQSALNTLAQQRREKAMALREAQMQRRQDWELRQQELAEARRQAAAARAGSAGPDLSGLFGGGGGQTGQYGYSKRADGGFSFVDQFGNPVSAATYAQATGTNFRQLLQFMANQGDQGAKRALGFVGDDYRYDPTKIGGGTPYKLTNRDLYGALTWGMPNINTQRGGGTSGSSGGGGRGW